MIVGHMIILSRNRLHQSILRSRFTLFSHKNGCSSDLRFSSVVGVFTLFQHFFLFQLNFRHWNLKISTRWRHREFSSTNSESVNKAPSDSGVKSTIRPGLSASRAPYMYYILNMDTPWRSVSKIWMTDWLLLARPKWTANTNSSSNTQSHRVPL